MNFGEAHWNYSWRSASNDSLTCFSYDSETVTWTLVNSCGHFASRAELTVLLLLIIVSRMGTFLSFSVLSCIYLSTEAFVQCVKHKAIHIYLYGKFNDVARILSLGICLIYLLTTYYASFTGFNWQVNNVWYKVIREAYNSIQILIWGIVSDDISGSHNIRSLIIFN